MPLIRESEYAAPWYLRNPHLHSILPRMLRSPARIAVTRERLELADGDFLDLDWNRQGHSRLVVISHGLEGDSRSP